MAVTGDSMGAVGGGLSSETTVAVTTVASFIGGTELEVVAVALGGDILSSSTKIVTVPTASLISCAT